MDPEGAVLTLLSVLSSIIWVSIAANLGSDQISTLTSNSGLHSN